jgi:hypothetical protein
LNPAYEPVRERWNGRGEFGKPAFFFPAHASQQSIDQAGEAAVAWISIGLADGEIDGGAIRDVKKQDLRRPDPEKLAQCLGAFRQGRVTSSSI